MDALTGQADWHLYKACPICEAAPGEPCKRFTPELGNMLIAHPARDMTDTVSPHPFKPLSGVDGCAEGFTDPGPMCGRPADHPVHAEQAPEPGPMWTNGTAPAAAPCELPCCAGRTIPWPIELDPHGPNAAPRVICPTWCTRHEHGMSTREPHTIELLNLAVLAEDLITDVPLSVYITQDLEPGSEPAVHLEIGHQLYQPTGVSLSRSDRARLASVLLTANHLTQQ